MFKKSIILFFMILSCVSLMAMKDNKNEKSFLKSNDQILNLLEFTEDAIQWRYDLRSHTKKMKFYMSKNDNKIRAVHYLELQNLAKKYVYEINSPLQRIIEGTENFLLFDDFFDIQTNQTTSVKKAVRRSKLEEVQRRNNNRRGMRFKTRRVKRYLVNPNDIKGQLLLRSFKMQLAAKLITIDNYILGLSGILDHSYLKRILLWDLELEHEEVKNTLWHTWKTYHKKYQNPRDLYQAYEIIEAAENNLKSNPNYPGQDKFTDQLDKVIKQSIIWKIVGERRSTINLFAETASRVALMNARQRDSIALVTDNVVYGGSELFGNIAGSFYKGKGKLYHYTDQQLQEIKNGTKALDVIFDKTGFRLTDSFIPGHFTHTAIWSGTEQELRELNVWNNLPALYERAQKNYNYKGPSFQKSIKTGHYIIEALRPGVQINNLRHFIDIDDLVFLRPKSCENEIRTNDDNGNPKCLTSKMKTKYLLESFKQIGKDYDFNFDVNTGERIVCSELVYRTFIDTAFETNLSMGRHTFVSDQIIPHADDSEDLFYPTLVIINGGKINEDVAGKQEILKLLKNTQYDIFTQRTGISMDY
ncbi:MAG: hypothetical protein HN576_00655 [Bacteriovoracaceae bacterium]|nr:hypothetical protein [Bacteriovoracaceae bacterium]